MKHYHFIEARNDKFGNRQVLWHTGNYMYEIEDRRAKKSLKLQCSFEDAKRIFQEVCVSY
jgi:hydrogenase maturation factor